MAVFFVPAARGEETTFLALGSNRMRSGGAFPTLRLLKSRNVGDSGFDRGSGLVRINPKFPANLLDALAHTTEADPDLVPGSLDLSLQRRFSLMKIFFVFTLLLVALHLGGTSAVIRHLRRIRNTAGLLVAPVSAYVFSIALDHIWASVISVKALTIVPIVAGIAYGFGFYLAACKLASKGIAARCAYMLIGTLALVAGFVGHKHNFAVGASMLLLSICLPFETQIAPARR